MQVRLQNLRRDLKRARNYRLKRLTSSLQVSAAHSGEVNEIKYLEFLRICLQCLISRMERKCQHATCHAGHRWLTIFVGGNIAFIQKTNLSQNSVFSALFIALPKICIPTVARCELTTLDIGNTDVTINTLLMHESFCVCIDVPWQALIET